MRQKYVAAGVYPTRDHKAPSSNHAEVSAAEIKAAQWGFNVIKPLYLERASPEKQREPCFLNITIILWFAATINVLSVCSSV